MPKGYSENVSFIHDVQDGVVTRLHFEGDTLTAQKTWDAEPHLEHARAMRDAQDGQRWGEGKFICHIPPTALAQIMAFPGRAERHKAMWRWLRENPLFVGYTRALRTAKGRA